MAPVKSTCKQVQPSRHVSGSHRGTNDWHLTSSGMTGHEQWHDYYDWTRVVA